MRRLSRYHSELNLVAWSVLLLGSLLLAGR
jgi:hypothetical protein